MPALIDAAQAHRDYIAGETLAVELALDGAGEAATEAALAAADNAAAGLDYSEETEIDDLPLSISLSRIQPRS